MACDRIYTEHGHKPSIDLLLKYGSLYTVDQPPTTIRGMLVSGATVASDSDGNILPTTNLGSNERMKGTVSILWLLCGSDCA
ncbi:hypothetical protein ACCO45_009921 [Purpureocillium lilacinum]|uniref:Uncharacterized protein n=1 Tax=Purpureocillium lilacinum TaxID=33203 RepID=A0ACC4DE24_PURLI